MSEVREHEHMMMFLNKIGESTSHMKLNQKKEYVRAYGRAAAIFEEALIPYLPKILQILQKKGQNIGNFADLGPVIAESFGLCI